MSTTNPAFCPDCAHERGGWSNGTTKCTRHAIANAVAVFAELEESAAYWSEYDVPVGIVERIASARKGLVEAESREPRP